MNNIIGSLEEIVLLLVMAKDEEIYGVSVAKQYTIHTGKSISIPAVHTVLRRLESKKMIQSRVGGASKERGGRSKRIYDITNLGRKTLAEIRDNRSKLWELSLAK
ncbi:MAG TPA: PadR family transcriptional regulator [Cyclobacteriaceae bacterium]|jgi:DNA-binding PadR family transcriptional regulator